MDLMNHMKLTFRLIAPNIFIAFCLISIGCRMTAGTTKIPSQTQNEIADETARTPDRSPLFDNRVTIIIPAGFKPLDEDKLIRKLPDNSFPKYIFSNSDQTGLVFVYLGDFNGRVDVKPEDLPEIKKFVEGIHRNYSGWNKSEFTEINGKQWFYFDWEEPKLDELVAPEPLDGETPAPTPRKTISHFQEFSTSFDKKLLRFVFQAEVEKYPLLKEKFSESSRTIKLLK